MAFSAAVLVSSTTIVSVKRCFFASRSSPSSLVTFADAPEEDDEGSSLSFFLFLLFLLLLFFLFLLREMPPLSLRDPFTEFVASMFSLKSGNPWRNCTNIIWRGSRHPDILLLLLLFHLRCVEGSKSGKLFFL